MPTIRQLPPHVVNQIAAGEVIERPASLVKELMENAVDAGARQIEVTVEKGGTERVRVVDDGCGMSAEQLPLAIASHATSKLRDADDLFQVATMGFRGEALASIASVGRLTVRSREPDAASGAELTVEGGKIGEVVPCGVPAGTVVEVEDLFFNTPVRRKFLRKPQTEFGHVSEAFTRIALAWPEIRFRLIHGKRTVFDLASADRWRDRIVALVGGEISEHLISIEHRDAEFSLRGYVADPSFHRSHSRMQYLFLNGRFIRDRSLQHALSEAYRGLLLTGKYPACFLRLDMPANWVDVNVHPTKLEVRFRDGGRIYRAILGSIRTRFLETDLTARVGAAAAPQPIAPPLAPAPPTGPPIGGAWSPGVGGSQPGAALPSASRADRGTGSASRTPWDDRPAWSPQQGVLGSSDSPLPSESGPVPSPSSPSSATPSPALGDAARPSISASELVARPVSNRGVQLQSRYLVAEEGDGIIVIDQHALHERILFERLKARHLSGELERQSLLVPQPVTLQPAEAAAVLEAQPLLEKLGLSIEAFGGDTILVSAYPAVLGTVDPESLLRRVVEVLMSDKPEIDRHDLLEELLQMMACKAAVKAGDALSREEVEALLEQRHLCHDAHHCPHGRPTALVFSRSELDRRFQRTS